MKRAIVEERGRSCVQVPCAMEGQGGGARRPCSTAAKMAAFGALTPSLPPTPRRRFYEHNNPSAESDKWVHKRVMDLEDRGFVSMTLPARPRDLLSRA